VSNRGRRETKKSKSESQSGESGETQSRESQSGGENRHQKDIREKTDCEKSSRQKRAGKAAGAVRASSRYVRVAPRKARLVADQIRGLHIDRARALLQFSPRGAAEDISKLIESAASNAENNHDLVADEMRVAEITVDEGPTLRRFRPRALGRATRINKRTSHIAVALSPEED